MGQFSASAGAEWAGTPRYRVTRTLGAGGMGVVYEAKDAERCHLVALKTLPCFDAAALYRFKQEFRTLADVRHENLVQLFELVVSSEAPAFFAMELVDGVDFTQHVRGAWAQQPRDPNRAEEVATRAGPIRSAAHAEERSESRDRFAMEDYDRRSPADFAKLRPALRQLCEGLCALHATGKLHRDIKPSNVLVTHAGRVVILDFGVATDVAAPSDQDDEVAGTPRYMAPEQAMSEAPTPAGDWYSVGVMLYEALAGRPPFVGTTAEVLKAKCLVPPIPPSALVDGLPRDLDELCVDLLQIEPAARPSGSAILSRLLSASDGAAPATQPVSLVPTALLVGREKERVRLEEAFEQVRADCAQTVLVGGAPGVGKSALVHRFVDDLLRSERAALLFGRAYERESLPYKAVDSVVDALSRRLVRAAEPIELPEDAWALARLFPVLERVPGLSQPPASRFADPQAVRRRAFGALRDILAALSAREPLVVFIDDVQWGDTDSVAALLEIRSPAGSAARAPRDDVPGRGRDGERLSARAATELAVRCRTARDARRAAQRRGRSAPCARGSREQRHTVDPSCERDRARICWEPAPGRGARALWSHGRARSAHLRRHHAGQDDRRAPRRPPRERARLR